jgi:hypothetical protein
MDNLFSKYQKQLLKLVNNNYVRKSGLLSINTDKRIDAIRPNGYAFGKKAHLFVGDYFSNKLGLGLTSMDIISDVVHPDLQGLLNHVGLSPQLLFKNQNIATHSDTYYSIEGAGASWSAAHDATSGTVVTTANLIAAYAGNDGGGDILRGFFSVDTTGALAGGPVSLSVVPSNIGVNSTTDTYAVHQGTQAATTALEANDFNNYGTTPYNTALAATEFTVNTRKSIDFNAAGIAAINTSGYTKFSWLNVTHDIGNSNPNTANVYVYLNALTSGKEAYLVITVASGSSFFFAQL